MKKPRPDAKATPPADACGVTGQSHEAPSFAALLLAFPGEPGDIPKRRRKLSRVARDGVPRRLSRASCKMKK
jgi:hypothetical protein